MENDLFRLFEISNEEICKPFSKWKLNVLNVRGVDHFSSDEVYQYFHRKPHSIEWLSDITCNVEFTTIEEACECLYDLAEAIVINKNDTDWTVYGFIENPIKLPIKFSSELPVPIPPNYRYILGKKHSKKPILIRFATIFDRKCSNNLTDSFESTLIKNNQNDRRELPKQIRSSSFRKNRSNSFNVEGAKKIIFIQKDSNGLREVSCRPTFSTESNLKNRSNRPIKIMKHKTTNAIWSNVSMKRKKNNLNLNNMDTIDLDRQTKPNESIMRIQISYDEITF